MTGYLTLCIAGNASGAEGFAVVEAKSQLKDRVYYLDARIAYQFNEPMLEVLYTGVPLTLKLDIEILRHRNYLWDETIASLEQLYQLQYHALARQYLIKNLNSGAQHYYPSLESAVSVLGTVIDLPVLDQNLLAEDEEYSGRIRARLVFDEFPVPLRLSAYLSPDWRIKSEWYTWSLQR